MDFIRNFIVFLFWCSSFAEMWFLMVTSLLRNQFVLSSPLIWPYLKNILVRNFLYNSNFFILSNFFFFGTSFFYIYLALEDYKTEVYVNEIGKKVEKAVHHDVVCLDYVEIGNVMFICYQNQGENHDRRLRGREDP